ncbi:hypothetical protein SY83_00975 [Paenibacillus swuensis]|uniref:Acyltransferase 3 domain-containing protein n=1 Tax=Paenibacillus swuensis TaxID=1178515 RepID=A0A172TDY2_9BACL|nr:acyltransferase [Paenibacillus swuensis]ANE45146.1 hypothetical protein SY83_00975 [Paenibacillus swuensis]
MRTPLQERSSQGAGKHIPELYIFRAMALFAVLIIHGTNISVARLDPQSSVYGVYLFANIFSSFAVPAFICVSGFVLFYSYYKKPLTRTVITTFYKKRTKYILVPYLIFSVLYFVIKSLLNPHADVQTAALKFVYQMLTGGAHEHLYYMFLMIQLYFLFPLLLWLMQKGVARSAILFGLAVQWGYIYVNREVIQYMTDLPGVFHKSGSILFSYFAYLMLGAYLGMFYSEVQKWLKRPWNNIRRGLASGILWFVWFALGSFYVYMHYLLRTGATPYHANQYSIVWCGFCLASSVVLLQASFVIYRNLAPKAVNTLIRIGIASFGIYLIHPLVLLFYRMLSLGNTPLEFHVFQFTGFVLSLMVSWLVTEVILRFLPWSWMLVGSVPRDPGYLSHRHKTAVSADKPVSF